MSPWTQKAELFFQLRFGMFVLQNTYTELLYGMDKIHRISYAG